MVSLARVASSLLTLLLLNCLALPQASQQNSPAAAIAALAGKVLGADGRPLPGIHVELDDAATAIPVTSTYTQPDGSFELYNIPKGNYEVVAESVDSQVSNAVQVDAERPSLELQLPKTSSSPDLLDATTSVARMLVPAKAQRLYNRALTEFTHGKYDEAEKELDTALQIDDAFADALTLRGLIDLQRGKLSSGQMYLERAIKADPSQSAAYVSLAVVYNHTGRFDDAMRASEKGLSLNPRTWQAYFEMAKASIAKSMYQRGLKFLRQAERMGGNAYAEVHLMKAYALVPLKMYKDAKYELQASMARDRNRELGNKPQEMLARLNSLENAGMDPHP